MTIMEVQDLISKESFKQLTQLEEHFSNFYEIDFRRYTINNCIVLWNGWNDLVILVHPNSVVWQGNVASCSIFSNEIIVQDEDGYVDLYHITKDNIIREKSLKEFYY